MARLSMMQQISDRLDKYLNGEYTHEVRSDMIASLNPTPDGTAVNEKRMGDNIMRPINNGRCFFV